MTAKRCKIHYRRLRRNDSKLPDKTFSELISMALNREIEGAAIKDQVKLRIAPTSADGALQRMINHLHIDEGFVFGNACTFTPGQMQALLKIAATESEHGTLDEAMATYEIREARANPGHEYIGGICYWLAIEDHFYQIQHTSLQAKQMEEYFDWLLKRKAGVIGVGAQIELVSEFDRAQIGSDLGDISSIEVGGVVPETISMPDDSAFAKHVPTAHDVETTESVGSQSASFEKAKKVLEALLGPIGTRSILDQIPSEAALEVKVNIGYKAKKRKFNKEFMGNLASGLRNLPDGEIRVRGRDGEMKGADVRLSMDMSVKKMGDDSSLLDMEHALEQMLEVHRRFVHDGKI